MRAPALPRRWCPAILAIALVGPAATVCPAIEMFTYFGDGSRIGLPSLEVPVEAYPGIPLRSDRLRARRRAMRTGGAPASASGRAITIRAMPAAEQPVAMPAARKAATPVEPHDATPAEPAPPPAPEPDDVTASSPRP